MAVDELWSWSATDLVAAVASRKISAREAAASAIQRMREKNPSVNAVVVDLGDEALRVADEADAAVARGDSLGLLHGAPVTVKENVDFKGRANVNGVPAYRNNIAPDDSPVVANLRKAGAVVIGLTNTPEFSMRAVTENPVHGRTLNPWDSAVTCGGSSGGA
ncbi:MAG: amidase family protein, partial [Beijerinckiaceae bacterium]